jgi:PTS system glucose-specific IIC component
MTFSGGMIDMVVYGILPVSKGTQFWWAFIIGAVLIPIYFFVFLFAIKKFNLSTPGRGDNIKLFTKKDYKNKGESNKKNKGESNKNQQALDLIDGFGGRDNIVGTANCATRLRYDVKDSDAVDIDKLKSLGAIGVVKVSKTHVQAIFGPQAEQLNIIIKAELKK